MKKIKTNVIPILAFILFELLYFAFTSYPQNILDIRLLNCSYGYYPILITKLFLFISFVIVITVFFRYHYFKEQFVSGLDFTKSVLKNIGILLPIRFAIDLLVHFGIALKYEGTVRSVFDFLFTAIIFLVVYRRTQSNDKKFLFCRNVYILITCLILGTILYITIHMNETLQGMQELSDMQAKYNDYPIAAASQNIDFKLSICTLIFHIFSNIMLYAIFYIGLSVKTSIKLSNSVVFVRCFLILSVFIVAVLLKAFILPQELLCRFNVSKDSTVSYQVDKKFGSNYKTFRLYRSGGYHRDDTLIYENTTIYITYGNQIVSKFTSDVNQSISKIVELDDGLFAYNTKAIMYLENDKPVCILSSDISKQTENPKLTLAIESMISLGYFEIMECAYDYLLRYDKAYLESILNEFADGEYEELQLNENIKSEYMRAFIQDKLIRDFTQ